MSEAWVNGSYDYLFRFGARAVTNKVSLIMMDNEAFDHFHKTRGQWDRSLHTRLLNKLADDGCPLVVMDCFFREARGPREDAELSNAMRRQRPLVLMAGLSRISDSRVEGMRPLLPAEPFLSAAGTNNWGVGWFDADTDWIVRRQWPFPSPGPYPSLAETAARVDGARLSGASQERWLRYYGETGQWTRFSYGSALDQPKNFFRDQIVFIGSEPATSIPGGDEDKFSTPYTRWTGEAVGGVEINLTAFLNLINDDWLRRPSGWMEGIILAAAGILLGAGLCQLRPMAALAVAAAAGAAVTLGAVSFSYLTNYWFPWLVIAGGQAPCALAWTFVAARILRPAPAPASAAVAGAQPAPEIPGYELHHPPFGQGAYGRVWLARNAQGQWRAVKVIYLANFGQDPDPFEREFKGVSRYKAISDQHPGLLRVDFLSEKLSGCFYYVMELGDSLEPGWENAPSTYKPHDLAGERSRSPGRRLAIRDCMRIGIKLSHALDFLHQQGLTHRDIKPQNILYVNGQPKLADLGLIAEIRPPDVLRTSVGTPGYMPPPPELPGTPQADIYALGIMLYVLSTGRDTASFPEFATTLIRREDSAEFFALNNIILKACQPDPARRYATAIEMHAALQATRESIQTGIAADLG
jgi:CHASE2 domain-containing sensor protein